MTNSPHIYTHDVQGEIDAAILAQKLRDAFKKTRENITEEAILEVARIVTQSKKSEFSFNKA